MKRFVRLFAVLICAMPLPAQRSVDARLTRERIVCVLPIVGAGTFDDPKRPLFAPRAGE